MEKIAVNEQIAYRLTSDKGFDKVVAELEENVAKHQFRVLAVHDVQQTLAEKGFERGPFKIVEVCNAGFAHEALGKSTEVGLFMPCRYTVHTDNNQTVVTLARPSVISQMLPDAGMSELAAGVEERLKQIIEEVV
jgi:uncharacterized protein (DUF302 family)